MFLSFFLGGLIMKYYKIIKDKEFIGVVTSINFKRQNPISGLMLTANEITGEYVRCNNNLYRDYWMVPLKQENISFIMAQVIEITEQEYNELNVIIKEADEIPQEFIEDENTNQPLVVIVENPNDEVTLEFAREAKIKSLSAQCRATIEAGFDIELFDLMTHHFSLDTQDQLNLITLSALAETETLIPYHADGELCKFYTAAEIKQIVAAATQFKMYHTTYFNALKQYINSLDSIDTIASITYGIELPEEFQSDVLKAIS